MRTKLRVFALILTLIILAFWFFGGPNLGWTKTSVARTEKDPVTDLEKIVYEKQFVPGIDFLCGGLAFAAVLSAGSFFFKKKSMLAEGHGRECNCSH